jgi:hypothetical protein
MRQTQRLLVGCARRYRAIGGSHGVSASWPGLARPSTPRRTGAILRRGFTGRDLSGSIRSRCSRRGSRRLDGAGRGWPGQARPGRRCLHGSANLQLTLPEWESLAFFRIYGRLSFLESTVRSKLEVCHGNLVLASPRRRVKFCGRGRVFQQNGVATYAVRKFSPRFPP